MLRASKPELVASETLKQRELVIEESPSPEVEAEQQDVKRRYQGLTSVLIFESGIPHRSLPRVSTVKSTSVPLRFA